MRVALNQQKKGVFARACMNSIAAADVSSSTVSIRFLVSGPGVLNGVPTDLAPARLLGRVAVRRLAAQHAARAKGSPEPGVARIGPRLRIFLGVEVIEVAEELVETMRGRQIFVLV